MAIARKLLSLLTLTGVVSCGSSGNGGNGGGGQVIQVGNNLDFAPTNGIACQDGFPVQINASFPQPFTGQGAPSCLLITFFNGAYTGTGGTVVSANIRIGPVTGPMRFVKARILYQSATGQACCSVQQYGPIFTPQANATTTVDLNFQMTEDHVPAPTDPTIVANDLVALEILAPDVPIPGVWTNNGGSDLGLPNYLYLPAMTTRGLNAPTQNLRSDGSFSGFLPSYNLNYRVARAGSSITSPEE
ncbi:MAG: hypothetical protein ABI679_15685 [Gemmatimonadota bacterium]